MRHSTLVLIVTLYIVASVGVNAEIAIRSDDFIESIGVCTHWSYTNTPYGFAYEQVKDKLIEIGIRHIRDGFSPHIHELGAAGIKTTVVMEPDVGNPVQLQQRVASFLNESFPTIDAIEGPNEPDLFWVKNNKMYNGNGFPQGAIDFLRDVYTVFKSNDTTKHLLVYGIALGKTYGDTPNPFAAGLLNDTVDYGNFHPYIGGNPFNYPRPYWVLAKQYWHSNFPSVALDVYPWQFNVYRPPYYPKYMVATETGYSTWVDGSSYLAHAKYMPRLYLEFFRLGVFRTFTYEFIDEFVDPDRTNREANFGLLYRNVTEKPAFFAVKSLIHLLQEKGAPSFTPGELNFNLTAYPVGNITQMNMVHRMLFQKSNGDFYLAFWHEITCEDTSVTPSKQVQAPNLPATLQSIELPSFASIELYTYNNQWTFTSQKLTTSGDSLTLEVSDTVSVIHFAVSTSSPQSQSSSPNGANTSPSSSQVASDSSINTSSLIFSALAVIASVAM